MARRAGDYVRLLPLQRLHFWCAVCAKCVAHVMLRDTECSFDAPELDGVSHHSHDTLHISCNHSLDEQKYILHNDKLSF